MNAWFGCFCLHLNVHCKVHARRVIFKIPSSITKEFVCVVLGCWLNSLYSFCLLICCCCCCCWAGGTIFRTIQLRISALKVDFSYSFGCFIGSILCINFYFFALLATDKLRCFLMTEGEWVRFSPPLFVWYIRPHTIPSFLSHIGYLLPLFRANPEHMKLVGRRWSTGNGILMYVLYI